MSAIQDWIHQLEEGGGLRFLRPLLLGMALVGLLVSYNLRGFRNMSNPEAMDAAQIARNLAEHRGFTTLMIRPFSLFLVQRAQDQKLGPAPTGDTSDRSFIRRMHPDLANAPVYPWLLSGLMKVAPPDYQTKGGKSIWNRNGAFWAYPPDFYISLLNQFLLVVSAAVIFFLARGLFDSSVAWTSAIVFLGTDMLWRFSISGLSTMLLILITLVLICCLIWLERSVRLGAASMGKLMALAGLTGVVLGVGALTRYSFACFLIPVVFFIVLFLGQHRVILSLAVLAAMVLVMAPWLMRNYQISHTLFGTAGYAALANTPQFTEFRLDRSLRPELSLIHYDQIWYKVVNNLRGILQDDAPKLGGNWITAFFLAGLMIGFTNPALNRLRWFVVACFPVVILAQAMGRTQLSDLSPGINTENLLILLMPVVIIFGVAVFFVLLDRLPFPHPGLRTLSISALCAVTCLPLLLTFFSARSTAIAYPPYYPPVIQKTAAWMKPDELIMSDIPWAVAWYGKRQSIWLTLNAQEDFFAVYDYLKPIKALYLTPETMDSRFLSQWVRASEHSWGSFVLETINRKEIPPYFPLRKAPTGFLPEQFFLTDTERWLQP